MTTDELRENLKRALADFKVVSSDLGKQTRAWMNHQHKADDAFFRSTSLVMNPTKTDIALSAKVIDEWMEEDDRADKARFAAGDTIADYYRARAEVLNCLEKFCNRVNYERKAEDFLDEIQDERLIQMIRRMKTP